MKTCLTDCAVRSLQGTRAPAWFGGNQRALLVSTLIAVAGLGLLMITAVTRPKATRHSGLAKDTAPAARISGADSWGWAPALSVVAGLALLMIASANAQARTGGQLAEPLFWLGLLTLFASFAGRLVSSAATRRERIILVVLLAMSLYLVKWMRSPLAFTLHDEFLHWRTVDDIIQNGHLFGDNPLLPVSPLYPGLESIGDALMSLTGMDVFGAGIITIAVARLALATGLYLLYEEITRSARIASISALLYMTYPGLLFFGAQFAYESVALPLAVLVLLAAAKWESARSDSRFGFALAVLLGIGAVTITHHVTAFLLAGLLALWALIGRLSCGSGGDVAACPATERGSWGKNGAKVPADGHGRRADKAALDSRAGLGWFAVFAIVLPVTWLVGVARPAAVYLAQPLRDGLTSLVNVILGQEVGRQHYASGGQLPPAWEQLVGYCSVALICLGITMGLRAVWQRYRANSLAIALGIVCLLYPISLAFRLTPWGLQLSGRSFPFVFVGVAFALAAVMETRLFVPLALPVHTMFTSLAAVLFLGGVVLGYPFWSYLPGPYLVSADMRSIEPQSTTAAVWAARYLGPDNRIGTDRVTGLLMGTYGRQYPVTLSRQGVDVPSVFFSHEIGSLEWNVLHDGRIRYLVLDRRLSTALPMVGVYYDDAEEGAFRHTEPITLHALTKFDDLDGVSRIFDSGDISIYDVGRFQDGHN